MTLWKELQDKKLLIYQAQKGFAAMAIINSTQKKLIEDHKCYECEDDYTDLDYHRHYCDNCGSSILYKLIKEEDNLVKTFKGDMIIEYDVRERDE